MLYELSSVQVKYVFKNNAFIIHEYLPIHMNADIQKKLFYAFHKKSHVNTFSCLLHYIYNSAV